MPSTYFSLKLSQGASRLLLGLILGTAYGLGMAALWGYKNSSSVEGNNAGSNAEEAVRPRIVCFGDSLTQFGYNPETLGWLALLAHLWERRFDVVNRGFSGYNTRWLLPLTEKIFAPGGAAPIKLATIFLGANDCVLHGNAQHVPVEEYKDNLKKMVAQVQKFHPEARVLLITPPPIHEGKWAMKRSVQVRNMDRKQEVTRLYADACLEVGEETSTKVVNAYSVMGSGDETLADKYLEDGVHFTSEGNRALFEAVKAEILLSFPELDPEHGDAAKMQAPHWSDVDPSNPIESVLRGL